jgi:hypothetical protein
MSWLSIFKKGGAVDRALDVVDKAVVDKDKAKEVKLEIIKIMASQQSPITRYVRAILAIMFFTVWLFFPENMVGREESTKYVLYGLISFYFLADFTIDKWKSK